MFERYHISRLGNMVELILMPHARCLCGNCLACRHRQYIARYRAEHPKPATAPKPRAPAIRFAEWSALRRNGWQVELAATAAWCKARISAKGPYLRNSISSAYNGSVDTARNQRPV